MSSSKQSPDESFNQAVEILKMQQEPLRMSEIDQANAIVGLVKELQRVEINSPLAEANALSISDNNGGRIELVDNDIPMKK